MSRALGFDELVALVSAARMDAYLRNSNGSKGIAAELYTWNVAIGGALWNLLAYVEVAVRNAMVRELGAICGAAHRRPERAEWFNHSGWYTARQRAAIREAKAKASVKGITSGRVVAQLTFGFWVSILDPAHSQTLWIPGLHQAFPHAPGGHKEVRGKLGWVNDLRNDIAHHNPLFERRILEAEQELIRTAYWVDPGLADWMASISTVRVVNASRPVVPPSLRWNAAAATPVPPNP